MESGYALIQKKVGVTRLERATTWSQTRCATNCATPRCFALFPKSDAKLLHYFGLCKHFALFYRINTYFLCIYLTLYGITGKNK